MNGDKRAMSAGRFAGLSRAAFARIPQMTVIARRAFAVCSICYIVQPRPIILPSRIINELIIRTKVILV